MDSRLLVVALPLLVAASWALFNIGRLALQQIQRIGRSFFRIQRRIENSQSYLTFKII